MSKIILRNWQKVIVDFVENYEKTVNSDDYLMSLDDFKRNDRMKVKMTFPKESGHTFLTAYLAAKFNAAVIFKDMSHYETIKNEIKKIRDSEEFSDSKSEFFSSYEIYYALASHSPDINKMKERFNGKKVIVADRASEIVPGTEDFIIQSATGAIIFLG